MNALTNPITIAILFINIFFLYGILQRVTSHKFEWVVFWIMLGPFAYIAAVVTSRRKQQVI